MQRSSWCETRSKEPPCRMSRFIEPYVSLTASVSISCLREGAPSAQQLALSSDLDRVLERGARSGIIEDAPHVSRRRPGAHLVHPPGQVFVRILRPVDLWRSVKPVVRGRARAIAGRAEPAARFLRWPSAWRVGRHATDPPIDERPRGLVAHPRGMPWLADNRALEPIAKRGEELPGAGRIVGK